MEPDVDDSDEEKAEESAIPEYVPTEQQQKDLQIAHDAKKDIKFSCYYQI